MCRNHRFCVFIGMASLLALAAAAAPMLAQEASPAGEAPRPSAPAQPTLSLDEAIALAMEHNPQVGAAEQGVELAKGHLLQALSYTHPRFEVSSSRMTPVDLPAFSFQSSGTAWETDFSLSQPLYTGGALSKGIRAADDYVKGAAGAYQRTQQQIAYAVRQAYYRVLTAGEQVKVSEEVVGSAEEHLRIAKLRYEAGVAPQFDVLSAEAYVARVEQGLIAAQTDLSIAREALSTVLGVHVNQDTRLTTPPAAEVPEADPEALKAEALAGRSDLLSAKAAVSAGAALLAAARGARQPTVTAAASYALRPSTTISGDLFGSPGTEFVVSQNSGNIILVANWSLYNGGQVTGEIRAAAAQLRQAEKGLASLQLQVGLDVTSAYLMLQSAAAQVKAAQKEVDQAREAHRIAGLRYQEGVSTSVEVLDAEAGMEGAKTRLNSAIYGLNLAVASLDLAVGRAWKPASAQPAPLVSGASTPLSLAPPRAQSRGGQ